MEQGDSGCGCGFSRRGFLAGTGAAFGSLAFPAAGARAETGVSPPAGKEKAVVKVAFIYPPSTTFSEDPDGWWSWPGNEFDAEGRQARYTEALRASEARLGLRLDIREAPIATARDADAWAREMRDEEPDGVLLILFYNRSLALADKILAAAETAEIPAIFFIGLGVKHGPVRSYRRPGVYFIQSLDNLEAIELGLRMVHTRKRLAQSLILSITEAERPREGVEAFFGIRVRVIPFRRYAEIFESVPADGTMRALVERFTRKATEVRGVTRESLENAARSHIALGRMLAEEGADGLTMNCLRRGMLKPCVSFSELNGQLVPAACENDLPAVYTQLLGQLLTGRPGFQHNPCYDTERDTYYASHCTCATRMHGPDGPALPYLLRRFAHTNEGSCAIQVFWKQGDPVTMVRYHPGADPALDVYAGRVVASHPMPPAAGCTTNVEVEITDRADACDVSGHHNLLFCGDFARRFRLFAGLCRMRLADTGYLAQRGR